MWSAPVMFGGGKAMVNAGRELRASAVPTPSSSQRSRQRGSTTAGAKVLSISDRVYGGGRRSTRSRQIAAQAAEATEVPSIGGERIPGSMSRDGQALTTASVVMR